MVLVFVPAKSKIEQRLGRTLELPNGVLVFFPSEPSFAVICIQQPGAILVWGRRQSLLARDIFLALILALTDRCLYSGVWIQMVPPPPPPI